MIARMGTGWQTLMADLSIILFMITAAALGESGGIDVPSKPAERPAQTPTRRSEPTAVYRVAPGMPPIGEWLAFQPRDPRQMLTIVSTYSAGRENAALDLATSLAREAAAAGRPARVVIEPGEGEATATLAYDASEVALARDLQSPAYQAGDQTAPGEPNSKGDPQ